MVSIRDYSTTAGSNTSLFPEGMAPGAVNDSAREVQAELAKLQADTAGTLTTGGTATAYTLTLTTAPAALTDGLWFWATASLTSTGGATTLVVTPSGGSAFASKKIKVFQSGAEGDPTAGSMIANNHYLFQYDSAADTAAGAYILVNPSSQGLVLINTSTVAAASVIDFTAGLTGFSLFELRGVMFGSAAANLLLRLSSNAGATFNAAAGDYFYALQTCDHTGTAADSGSSTTATAFVVSGLGSTNSLATTFCIRVANSSTYTAQALFTAEAFYTNPSGSNRTMVNSAGRAQLASPVFDALRLLPATGTVTGKVSLYGVREQ